MKKLVITVILGIVIVIAVLGFFYFNDQSSNITGGNTLSVKDDDIVSSSSGSDANPETKVFTIDAKKFEFSPNIIKVKKGDHVKIIVNNMDFEHGISIPDFNVKGTDSVEFTADKTGTFQFRCPTMCGEGHREMTGTLVVEE